MDDACKVLEKSMRLSKPLGKIWKEGQEGKKGSGEPCRPFWLEVLGSIFLVKRALTNPALQEYNFTMVHHEVVNTS
jgi:hypothetical protein